MRASGWTVGGVWSHLAVTESAAAFVPGTPSAPADGGSPVAREWPAELDGVLHRDWGPGAAREQERWVVRGGPGSGKSSLLVDVVRAAVMGGVGLDGVLVLSASATAGESTIHTDQNETVNLLPPDAGTLKETEAVGTLVTREEAPTEVSFLNEEAAAKAETDAIGMALDSGEDQSWSGGGLTGVVEIKDVDNIGEVICRRYRTVRAGEKSGYAKVVIFRNVYLMII